MIFLICVGLVSFIPQNKSNAAGPYDDYGRYASFVMAPRRSAVEGRATITDAPDHEASVYFIAARFPIRERFLVQTEFTYAARASMNNIEDGLGDLFFRGKALMWRRDKLAVSMLAGLRTGSGSELFFPYSTGSIDYELGVAVVDTLHMGRLWTGATGGFVTRASDRLSEMNLHDHYLNVAGGVVFSVTHKFDVQLGIAGYFQHSTRPRSIYFTEIEMNHSRMMAIQLLVQAEGGGRDNRAVDLAIGAGLRVTY